MILIPENLKGKKLFDFLVANKKQLIAEKKAAYKTTDIVRFSPLSIAKAIKIGTTKDNGSTIDEAIAEDGVFPVKVVANAAWWCDSQMDVLTDTCYDKSIAEKGILIPHISDHEHKSTSHVGDVQAVYKQKISLKELGLSISGATTCLVFETNIMQDYNDQVYKFYKNGKINQHSIGLLYIMLCLCINDKEYGSEFEAWNKYYDKVINKDLIDERGYFWCAPEIRVMENSCVLFGANELTPTLQSEDTGTAKGSLKDTQQQPPTKKRLSFAGIK